MKHILFNKYNLNNLKITLHKIGNKKFKLLRLELH